MLRVNVGGVIAMTREAAAVMAERAADGAIVNVSSIEGPAAGLTATATTRPRKPP